MLRKLDQRGRAIVGVLRQIDQFQYRALLIMGSDQRIERLLKASADGRFTFRHRRQRDHGVAHLPAEQRQQPRLQVIELVVAIHDQQIDVCSQIRLLFQRFDRQPALAFAVN